MDENPALTCGILFLPISYRFIPSIMDHPPKKRRWQFSLKVLFIAITMAGVGMGLLRFWYDFANQRLLPYEVFIAFNRLGWILLLASPGVPIGYGFNRLRGAIIGGIVSVVALYYFIEIIEPIIRFSI